MADFEADAELITEYVQWVATYGTRDTSPTAFLIERAKETAFERVEAVIDLLVRKAKRWNPDTKKERGYLGNEEEIINILNGSITKPKEF